MSFIAKKGGNADFQLIPTGLYAAVCYGILDLGHQYSAQYNKWQPKIRLMFECHGDNQEGDGTATLANGSPMTIGADFTLSLADNSRLLPILQGWRGRPFTPEELEGFDVRTVVGHHCMLAIEHTKLADKTYANIKMARPILKSLTKPVQFNPALVFAIEPWEQAAFDALPGWLQDKIKESKELRTRFGTMPDDNLEKPNDGAPVPPPFDDDIPF